MAEDDDGVADGSNPLGPPPAPGSLAEQVRTQNLVARMFGAGEAIRVGHYELGKECGRGGMGVVYAAWDTQLHRRVAVKEIRARGDVHLRRRVVREARAMAMLDHRNVVTVHAIIEEDDVAYIVMEYVTGVTLTEWLREPRSRGQIFAAFCAAGAGLAEAHAKGLVHRDFKPDNVMIDGDGRVRMMDFGLAHSGDPQLRSSGPRDAVVDGAHGIGEPLTVSGEFAGTPAYMAPEQLRGGPTDTASDQFSFSVALWEALFGERPFEGATHEALHVAIEGGRLRRSARAKKVPAWLREIVTRGLRAAPSERYPSMRGLLDALAAGAKSRDVDANDPPEYVFVAHDVRDKLAVLELCGALLDRGVRPWLDVWERHAGDRRGVPVADVIARAPAVLLCHGPSNWSSVDAGLVSALESRLAAEPGTVYRVELPGAAKGRIRVGEGCEGVTLDDPVNDAALDELAALLGVDCSQSTWLAAEVERSRDESGQFSPYRGLAAFRERDARWMFGREQEVDELLARLHGVGPRLHVVAGASGSGKSSLVMAGVCPAIRNGALGHGHGWEIGHLRPGARPCESLAHALVGLTSAHESDPVAQVKELRAQLMSSPDTLGLVVRQIAASRRQVFLVVDQLEELFTEAKIGGDGGSPEAMAFVRNIIDACEGDSGLYVISTLRADFIPSCLELAELAVVLKQRTHFVLPPMSEQQLRAAIERPARRVGYAIEASLVEKLVLSTARQAGRLPLLQHLLRELWLRGDSSTRKIPASAYGEAGGLEGAIAAAAERTLDELRARLGQRAEIVTRRIMTRLVCLGETASSDTRRRVPLTELGDDRDTQEALAAFVRRARALVVGDEGADVVEIVHDALLREWTALMHWLADDRVALRLRQDIAEAVRLYSAEANTEYLWGRGRVEEAERLLNKSTVELNAGERNFLAECWRLVHWQDQLSARRRLAWIVTFGAIVVASLVVAWIVEQKNHDIVDEQRALRQALSEQRGLRARMLIPEDSEAEALTLAVEAVGIYGPDFAEEPPNAAVDGLERVLTDDTVFLGHAMTLVGHAAEVYDVAYSPDGARMTTVSKDGTGVVWDSSTGTRVAVLRGHQGAIFEVRYSPDGARVLTAGEDRTAKIWDANTGRLLAESADHASEVRAIAWSPAGDRVLSGDDDGSAKISDARSGKVLAALEKHRGTIKALAYAPDGSFAVTGSADGAAIVWDTQTGVVVTTFSGHQDAVLALAVAPDGTAVVTGSADGTAAVWDPRTGERMGSLTGHIGGVTDVVFAPGGQQIATGGRDAVVKIWSRGGEGLATLRGHLAAVVRVRYSPDGQHIASAGDDHSAMVWDVRTERHLFTLHGHDNYVYTVAWSPRGASLATASYDQTARIWGLTPDSVVSRREGHTGEVRTAHLAPDGGRIATGGLDGAVKIWSSAGGELLATLGTHSDGVWTLVFSPDGRRIATASIDGSAEIWDIDASRRIAKLRGHTDHVVDVAYSPDGAQLATASKDGTVRLWDSAGAHARTLRQGSSVQKIAYSPDGEILAAADIDGKIKLWGPAQGTLLATLDGHHSDVWSIAFSPDGSRLAAGSSDKTATIWDVASGRREHVLIGHTDFVHVVSFAPEGDRVLTASKDCTAKIWSVATGEELLTLREHTGMLWDAEFSADGALIATASEDRRVLLWDATSGTLVRPLVGHTHEVNDVEFSADGGTIVTASDDRTGRVWSVASGEGLRTLTDRVGLQASDGSFQWPLSYDSLVRIGCERLRVFDELGASVAAICASPRG